MPGQKQISELICPVLCAALWVIIFKLMDLGFYILFCRLVTQLNHTHWLIWRWEDSDLCGAAARWGEKTDLCEWAAVWRGGQPFLQWSLLQTSVKMLKAWKFYHGSVQSIWQSWFSPHFVSKCISILLLVLRWDVLVTYTT